MNDNHIPEATAAPTYVEGRLAPPDLARMVRRGWVSGCVLLSLQALFLVAVSLTYPMPARNIVVTLLEIAVGAGLVAGTRRWLPVPAWLLLAYPFACFLINGWLAGPPSAGTVAPPGQGGMLGVVFLVVFGMLFGQAAIAIRTFRKARPDGA